eukprot:CAMPEP_0118926744 /NCGR_PEP_ID=MMETSP1169-20130426/4365_1 /TAXON_ID=36882 /ORGANISM="Pyramimonas obovata, Strain CCMP722" /LENGTH=624 /DNA_ID=CAMNT_0006868361 /DNA_START=264 /DNA_END=2138 /DNA_ORIENTATION=-
MATVRSSQFCVRKLVAQLPMMAGCEAAGLRARTQPWDRNFERLGRLETNGNLKYSPMRVRATTSLGSGGLARALSGVRMPASSGWERAQLQKSRPSFAAQAVAQDGAVDADGEESTDEIEFLPDVLAGYNAAVKILVTEQSPDWINPWQTRTAHRRMGSGVLIARKGEPMPGSNGDITDTHIVLTAAHVIANSTFIQVQLSDSPDRHMGRVCAVLHECDLALIAIDEDNSFEDVTPMSLAKPGTLPSLRDKVHVLGFPVGGDEVSITEGVVSRVEVQTYSHSHTRALAVTVDAAVNSGNSGGPVVSTVTGELIGIAFQGYAGSHVENQGHMVPVPLVHHFLEGVARGNPRLPSLGVHLQLLQSPVLRRSLKMREGEHTGVLISRVDTGASSRGVLFPGDVVMRIDGLPIANDGSCVLYHRRLALISNVQRRFVGDKVPLQILRNGEEMEVEITLAPPSLLVPRGQYDVRPPFLLVGGLLFQPLSLEFLQSWGDLKDAPVHLVEEYYSSAVEEERREVVCLTQVLQDEVNLGYFWESIGLEVVTHVNDQPVASIQRLVELLDDAINAADQEFVTLKLGRGRVPQCVVLEVAKLAEADLRIRTRYNIPKPRSDHFMPAKWLEELDA